MGFTERYLERDVVDELASEYICSDCLSEALDDVFGDFLQSNVMEVECRYCKRVELLVAPLSDVLGHVRTCLSEEYDIVENVLFRDNGGWAAEASWILSSEDLAGEAVCNDNQNLIKDIATILGKTQQWCHDPPYLESEDEPYQEAWSDFCYWIMHEIRYLFPVKGEKDSDSSPSEILHEIGGFIHSHSADLIRELPTETVFYRMRCDNRPIEHTIKAMGSPPHKYATAGRMNAAGISCFYGASSVKCAYHEAKAQVNGDRKNIAIGKFRLRESAVVLDLTKIDAMVVPSYFSLKNEQRMDRSVILFLKHFLEEISKSINPDRLEKIEYVPTQVVAEYFQHQYGQFYGQGLQGIIFPSSRCKGNCCVLFLSDIKMDSNMILSNVKSAVCEHS